MNLTRWDPYRDLATLTDRFHRAFGLAMPDQNRDEEMSLGSWLPPVDIAEDKDTITLTAELPGFQENQIQIHMEGGVLTLRGERKLEDENEGRHFHRVERSYGRFVRSFTLPNNIDREAIKASFDDGLLKVVLPKREEAKPRQIKISADDDEKAINVKTS